MADSALSTDPLERYGAIERAYCEERWTSVIHDGQTLLADLSRAIEAPPEGLKERLQLLIAHAFLYGLGDRDNAEDFYQAVLDSGAEASLRQIAEQGLQQCSLPVAPPEFQDQQLEQEEEASPPSGPVSSSVAGASVWQEAAPAVIPVDPAIPSEPDSARAIQEGSAQLQSPQDSWGSAAAQAPSGEVGALSWLTADAAAAPQDSAVQPVMPWLEPSDSEDLAVRPERLEPVSDARTLQQEQAWMPLAAAPTQAGSVPVVQAAAWDASAGPVPPDGDDRPPLSPETAASLQATTAAVAAAFQMQGSGLQLKAVLVTPAPAERSDAPVESPDSLEAAQASRDAVEASAAAASSTIAAEQRLLADVVEEPELMELPQADRFRHEELLLEADAQEPAPFTVAERGTALPAPAELGPTAWMDRRGPDTVPSDVQDRRAEQAPDPVPAEASAAIPVSSRGQAASGLGPFSGPPEPVAEEDPELLMGLLKVEMG